MLVHDAFIWQRKAETDIARVKCSERDRESDPDTKQGQGVHSRVRGREADGERYACARKSVFVYAAAGKKVRLVLAKMMNNFNERRLHENANTSGTSS